MRKFYQVKGVRLTATEDFRTNREHKTQEPLGWSLVSPKRTIRVSYFPDLRAVEAYVKGLRESNEPMLENASSPRKFYQVKGCRFIAVKKSKGWLLKSNGRVLLKPFESLSEVDKYVDSMR